MPGKRIAESLTARIFLITAGILLFAGAVTFGFIAWATPSTYTAVVNDDLTAQVDTLVERLADTVPEDCGELLDEFVLSSGANAMLVGPDGALVDTGAKLTVYTQGRGRHHGGEGYGGQLWDRRGHRGDHDHHRLRRGHHRR